MAVAASSSSSFSSSFPRSPSARPGGTAHFHSYTSLLGEIARNPIELVACAFRIFGIAISHKSKSGRVPREPDLEHFANRGEKLFNILLRGISSKVADKHLAPFALGSKSAIFLGAVSYKVAGLAAKMATCARHDARVCLLRASVRACVYVCGFLFYGWLCAV